MPTARRSPPTASRSRRLPNKPATPQTTPQLPLPSAPTNWAVVIAAFGAGVVGAAHVGKVPAALPAIRAEFVLDLVTAGWVVSIFSATALLFAMAAGLLSDRVGHRRIAVGGLLLLAAGSAAGALAASGTMMLATRLVEGLGYIIAVVAAPSIIAQAAAPKDRRLAVGLWGAFMPTGMGAMLVAAPFLQSTIGWRGSWAVTAALTVIWAAVMAYAFHGWHRVRATAAPERPWRNLLITVRARGPWLLSLCFAFYALPWIALMVWLPTFIVEQRGLPVRYAALLTVAAVTINLPGNILGGWLSHKSVPRGILVAAAGTMIVVAGPLIYLDLLPDGARFAACLVYSFVCGVVPAALLGAAPWFAPGPGQIATTNGLIVQGSHLGLLSGPPLVAALVGLTGGWQGGALLFAACGAGVLVFAALIHREEGRLATAQGSSESSTP
ncbi:MAG: MFS transporter [Alphaproteobacteria bacterium]|nr:MFS transporter [Alphaproteobacteria bacterium]